jgi:AraC family transcriptional regulator
MEPRIETINEKKLIGISLTMSLTNNRTSELWRSFMPRRKEITNGVGNEVISLQIYQPDYFTPFNPAKEFTKWACVEVSDFSRMPADMSRLIVPTSLYAVFRHRGASNDNSTYNFIFGTWLPGSKYTLDNRPHFEVLGDKYKNLDPTSEEDIYIPVRLKA